MTSNSYSCYSEKSSSDISDSDIIDRDCFPNPVGFERRMQQVLLEVFIQLGLHMVDTVPGGIRIKIRCVTIYNIQSHQVV